MFKPKTFSVDLIGTSSPNGRALLIIAALPEAEEELGEKPTHALVDGGVRVNIDLLDEYGIRVKRQSVAWVSRYTVRLAVAVAERSVRAVPGAPAPVQVQRVLL